MNDKIEAPTMQVPPLKRICMTIGQLPTSYLETMSYYEMLVWFVNYLRDDIIPVVNANGLATKELQELFVELQNYVNDYFDNQDWQQMVDNKLEDMLEDGTLQEIITQYLQIAGVLAFNTINNLKTANNLIDGSICFVTDNGNYYKVREKQESDIPDDDNLIALTNYNDLIAEKVQYYDIKTVDDFVIYTFFDETSQEISFYISKDNLHLEKINIPTKLYGRDPSIIYYNEKFYVAVTNYTTTYDFMIYESPDLITWTTHYINLGLYDETYQKRWAPQFFIDDDESLYVFISKQYAAIDSSNLAGKFKTYIARCNDIDTLSFDTPTEITLTNTLEDNFIDACCIKIDDTYHLILKCDKYSVITLFHFTSTNLTTFTYVSDDFGQFGRFMEGQFVYKFKDEFVVGCESYGIKNSLKSIYKIKTSKDFTNFSNYKTMYLNDVDLSHGSAFVITNKRAKQMIFNINNYGFKYDYPFDLNDKNNYLICSASYAYDFPKGRYLKIMSIKPKYNYKGSSIIFKLTDGQRMYIDSLIQIEVKVNQLDPFTSENQNVVQLSSNIAFTWNYLRSNLHGKIICVPNTTNKCYDVYFDLNDYGFDLTLILEMVSHNLYDADIQIYTDVFTNTLPVDIGHINSAYRCKNMFAPANTLNIDNTTNTKLVFKMCMLNGSFKVLGHTNGIQVANVIDYTVNVSNGSINAINNNDSAGTQLTFAVDNYSTDRIYTISITGIPNYSGFTIILPNVAGSSILGHTLSAS